MRAWRGASRQCSSRAAGPNDHARRDGAQKMLPPPTARPAHDVRVTRTTPSAPLRGAPLVQVALAELGAQRALERACANLQELQQRRGSAHHRISKHVAEVDACSPVHPPTQGSARQARLPGTACTRARTQRRCALVNKRLVRVQPNAAARVGRHIGKAATAQ